MTPPRYPSDPTSPNIAAIAALNFADAPGAEFMSGQAEYPPTSPAMAFANEDDPWANNNNTWATEPIPGVLKSKNELPPSIDPFAE